MGCLWIKTYNPQKGTHYDAVYGCGLLCCEKPQLQDSRTQLTSITNAEGRTADGPTSLVFDDTNSQYKLKHKSQLMDDLESIRGVDPALSFERCRSRRSGVTR